MRYIPQIDIYSGPSNIQHLRWEDTTPFVDISWSKYSWTIVYSLHYVIILIGKMQNYISYFLFMETILLFKCIQKSAAMTFYITKVCSFGNTYSEVKWIFISKYTYTSNWGSRVCSVFYQYISYIIRACWYFVVEVWLFVCILISVDNVSVLDQSLTAKAQFTDEQTMSKTSNVVVTLLRKYCNKNHYK